ncbi:MAG TPA: SAM-dependent methyltransferase [Acidobacteriaceae bacterium]|nr:SAM-dependent methyltransferase [Acidobacteriaceae bacterium]
METGLPSRTALGVAIRRAVHQLLDQPPVLNDPIAIPILGERFHFEPEQQAHPYARAFRAFMAARSRLAEDQLARAAAKGVNQYVLLGAGLDTFAYRNPWPQLRVFEVDHPATQLWKRTLLHDAKIAEPANLSYAPLDFEHHTLHDGLTEAGFDFNRPAFFAWLGVVPYLTLKALRGALDLVAAMPAGSGIVFDYALSDEDLSPRRRQQRAALAARVAAVGEPFQLFFRLAQLENELKSAGFASIEQIDSHELNCRYFTGRSDGLALPEEGLGQMAVAWVE